MKRENNSHDNIDPMGREGKIINQPVHLKWKINSKVQEMIEEAKQNAEKLINDVNLVVIHERNLNSSIFKNQRKIDS